MGDVVSEILEFWATTKRQVSSKPDDVQQRLNQSETGRIGHSLTENESGRSEKSHQEHLTEISALISVLTSQTGIATYPSFTPLFAISRSTITSAHSSSASSSLALPDR